MRVVTFITLLHQYYRQLLQVMEKGNKQSYTALKHHQLGDAYNNRFNGKISSLLQFLQECNLSIGATDYQPIQNIVTGQVFPEDIC